MFLMAVGLSLGALLLGAMADRLRKGNIRTEVLLAGVGALFIVAELALVLRIPLPSLLTWNIVSIAGAATVLSFAVIADYFPREFAARANGDRPDLPGMRWLCGRSGARSHDVERR
jgi:hypothetical protein